MAQPGSPEPGQILDADIILTDGWIRHFDKQFSDFMPMVTMEGMGAETKGWLANHPSWDPRVRFADPSQRQHIAAQIRAQGNAAVCRTTERQLEDQNAGR